MNCKQGDLAIVSKVRGPGAGGQGMEHNGKIVRCVEMVVEDGFVAWIVEPRLGRYHGVLDRNLRPLRNPGDDEVDEMLVMAGKPQGVAA